MSTVRNQYYNFGFFHKVFFKNTKNAPILTILVGCGWLMNLSLTDRQTDRQTDIFRKNRFF